MYFSYFENQQNGVMFFLHVYTCIIFIVHNAFALHKHEADQWYHMPIFPEKRILSNCMARHLHKQDTYITEFDSKLSRFSEDLIESFSLDE